MNYILLLGGNTGDVDQTMERAESHIRDIGQIRRRSGIYESAAWGYESALPFHNRVIEVACSLNPFAMLDFVQEVERRLGRTHKTTDDGQYADRPIDIDILFCDHDVLQTPGLSIPHPRLHLRKFTLAPLMEHWSDFWHPRLLRTINELYADCPDKGAVTRIGD